MIAACMLMIIQTANVHLCEVQSKSGPICVVTITEPRSENGSGFVRNEPCAAVLKRLDERFGVIPS